MTTVHESTNGHHHLFPPPFSVEDALGLNRADLPTNKADSHSHIDTQKLPDRCQFTFSDGRQCTMARSDIHPSLCLFHAEREYQLFGEPSPASYVVGRALDLPELYSACRDLTTATSVNRVLAQVFRLLAQRRISRQEAATFGHLAQLLLRTISLMRQENLTIPLGSSGSAAKDYPPPRKGYPPAAKVYQSPCESHGDQELSRANNVELRGANKVQELSRVNNVPATPNPAMSSAESPSAASDAPLIPRTSFPASTKEPLAAPNPAAHNSRRINTSENADFKAVQNEDLRKIPEGSSGGKVGNKHET